MKNRLIALLLLLAATLLPAQEQLSFEEMFRWLPQGKFSVIRHCDLDILRENKFVTELVQARDTTVAGFFLPTKFPLFEEFHKELKSITVGTDVRLVVYTGEQRESLRGGGHTSMDIGDKVYRTNSAGVDLYIFRFEDSQPQIQKLREAGRLEPSGKTFFDSPVYQISSHHRKRKDVDYFLWASPFNEILLCEKLEKLEQMVKAGNGELPSIAEAFPYEHVEPLLPQMGHAWSVYSHINSVEAIFQKAEKDGVDPAVLEQRRESALSFFAPSILKFQVEKDKVIRQSGRRIPDKAQLEIMLQNPKFQRMYENWAFHINLYDRAYLERLKAKNKAKEEENKKAKEQETEK